MLMVEEKPVIGHINDVKEEDVTGAKNTKIQWLIHKDVGAKRFAMRRFTIKRGGEIPKHAHPWEHEIYILSGTGVIGIGDKEYTVSEDMFIYVPPNVEHWYKNTGDEDFVFICVIPYLE